MKCSSLIFTLALSYIISPDSYSLDLDSPFPLNTTVYNIAYSLDNNYTYTVLVSVTSALLNKSPDSFYNYTFLLEKDFDDESKKILLSAKRNMTSVKMNFVYIENEVYNSLPTRMFNPTASYYRFELIKLMPNIDKLLYLDGDTLINRDLSAFWELNMTEYYIAGQREYNHLDTMAETGLPKDHYINAGVTFWNLKLMRENNIFEKIMSFIKNLNLSSTKDFFMDQTTINVICHGKIKVLLKNYSLWTFLDERYFKDVENIDYANHEEIIKEISKTDYPLVRHLIFFYEREKPWKYNVEIFNQNEIQFFKYSHIWYSYAYRTKYFDEIVEKNFLQMIEKH